MISKTTLVAVSAIAVIALAGGGTAVAANGGTFKLGGNNTATKTTALANSKGVPLSLKAKSGYPPLKVNSSKVVTNLNADKVDGLSSSSFALSSGRTGYVAVYGYFIDIDGDGFGDGLAGSAKCPTGSKLTGGGLDNYASGEAFVSSPSGGGNWDGLAIANELGGDTTTDLIVYAVCYNPRGAVSGASSTLRAAVRGAETMRSEHVDLTEGAKSKLAKAAANQ